MQNDEILNQCMLIQYLTTDTTYIYKQNFPAVQLGYYRIIENATEIKKEKNYLTEMALQLIASHLRTEDLDKISTAGYLLLI